MGHTLTLFGFLFESCNTFRQLVVSSTGPPDLHHYGLLPSGMLPSGLYLRVCAFGFVALLYCFRSWSFVTARVILGLESSGSWILVYTVLSTCKFSDVSFICIFPRYRPSMLVIMSRMMRSVCLAELVYLIGICYLPFWLNLGYLYHLFLCDADDMRLVLLSYDSSFVR